MPAIQTALVDGAGNIAVHGRAAFVIVVKFGTAVPGVYRDISADSLWFEVAGLFRLELAAGDTDYSRKIVVTNDLVATLPLNGETQFDLRNETPEYPDVPWSGVLGVYGYRTAPPGETGPVGTQPPVSGATVIVETLEGVPTVIIQDPAGTDAGAAVIAEILAVGAAVELAIAEAGIAAVATVDAAEAASVAAVVAQQTASVAAVVAQQVSSVAAVVAQQGASVAAVQAAQAAAVVAIDAAEAAALVAIDDAVDVAAAAAVVIAEAAIDVATAAAIDELEAEALTLSSALSTAASPLIFDTSAQALANPYVTNGTYVWLAQAFGLGADNYQNVGGVITARGGSPLPLGGPGFDARLIQILSDAPPVVAPMPLGALYDISTIDAVFANQARCANRAGTVAPDGNLFVFDTGEIRGAVANDTKITRFSSGNKAKLTLGTNQSVILFPSVGQRNLLAAPNGAVRASGVTVFQTSGNFSTVAGDTVTVQSVTDTSFNGDFTVLSSPAPTLTTFAASNPGTDGTSGGGLVFQTGLPVLVHGETYTFAFAVNAFSGAGTQSIRFGQSSAYGVNAAVAEGAAVKVTVTFVYDRTLPIVITTASGGTATVEVDELQLYPGSTTPTWADNHDGNLKGSWGYDNSLVRTGSGYGVVASRAVGAGTVTLPSFPASTLFSETTELVVFRAGPALPVSTLPIYGPIYDNLVSPIASSATHGLYVAATNYEMYGQTTWSVTGCFKPLDGQIHVAGVRRTPGGQELWIDGVPVQLVTTAYPGQRLLGEYLGRGPSGTAIYQSVPAGVNSYTDLAIYRRALYDEALSNEDFQKAFTSIFQEQALRGAPIAEYPFPICTAVDSLTYGNAVPRCWPWKMQDLWPTGAQPPMMNVAAGGAGFNQIDPLGPSYATGPWGQRASRIYPWLDACAARGVTPVYILLDGQNDYKFISALPGQTVDGITIPLGMNGWEYYRDTWIIPYLDSLRARNPDTKVILGTSPVRGDRVCQLVNYPTYRATWNAWKAANWQTIADEFFDLSATPLVDLASAVAAGYMGALTTATVSITGTVMTVTAVSADTIGVNACMLGGNVLPGTSISAQLTGTTGGVGTYTISPTQTAASASVTVVQGDFVHMAQAGQDFLAPEVQAAYGRLTA